NHIDITPGVDGCDKAQHYQSRHSERYPLDHGGTPASRSFNVGIVMLGDAGRKEIHVPIGMRFCFPRRCTERLPTARCFSSRHRQATETMTRKTMMWVYSVRNSDLLRPSTTLAYCLSQVPVAT